MSDDEMKPTNSGNQWGGGSFVPVMAGGGVVYETRRRQLYVVLIYRKGVWDLPKGKREPGESPEECAIREVGEEIHITPSVKGPLGTTVHSYERDGVTERKTTYWYAMQAPDTDQMKPETQEQIEKVSWFPLSTAINMVGYDNLKKVLQRFNNWITDQETADQ